MENFENGQLHGCATVHLAREKLKPVLDHCLLNSSVQLSLQLRSCIARKELENQDFFLFSNFDREVDVCKTLNVS